MPALDPHQRWLLAIGLVKARQEVLRVRREWLSWREEDPVPALFNSLSVPISMSSLYPSNYLLDEEEQYYHQQYNYMMGRGGEGSGSGSRQIMPREVMSQQQQPQRLPLPPCPEEMEMQVAIPEPKALIAVVKTEQEDEENEPPRQRMLPAIAKPPGDNSPYLEDLEKFAKHFKQRRSKLGFSQQDVGASMGQHYGEDFSQTTISRFEALNLSYNNMVKLMPLLQRWLRDVEREVMDPSAPAPTSSGSEESKKTKTVKKRRKRRSIVSSKSREGLERAFLKDPNPNRPPLEELAKEFSLDFEVVRVWFCNRRQKEKRDKKAIPKSAGAEAKTTRGTGKGPGRPHKPKKTSDAEAGTVYNVNATVYDVNASVEDADAPVDRERASVDEVDAPDTNSVAFLDRVKSEPESD